VSIDDEPVTNKNVVSLLVGNDVPGSIVRIQISRGSAEPPEDVTLKRACTAHLADKKKMFQVAVTACPHRTRANQGTRFARCSVTSSGGP